MPVVDKVSNDYAGEVAFVAPAWKQSRDGATAQQAAALMPSGVIQWGLDAEQTVFSAYGVSYQPVTVLITADGHVAQTWAGAVGEEALRAALDDLLTWG